MRRLIVDRMAGAGVVTVSVIVVTFLLTRVLPADPAVYFAGLGGTPEAIAAVRKKLGLDRSLVVQFGSYVRDLLTGDLGASLTTGHPVAEDLLKRLPASFELTVTALGLAVVAGIGMGILAALRPGSWLDHLVRIIGTAGVAMPTFFTGLLLLHIFYFELGWAPAPLGRLSSFVTAPPRATGFYLVDSIIAGNAAAFLASAAQIALPALTLALFAVAPLSRATRAAMLEALASDFVRTARAIPLGPIKTVVVYALGNALLPVLTTAGMVFSFLLGANVLVEKVFGWPGVGSYATEALIAADYAPVQGFVLVMSAIYILLNLAIDIVVIIADPRAAAEHEG
jgi:ABC-type dipeptide/oligopeptide/nickel transport system permease component